MQFLLAQAGGPKRLQIACSTQHGEHDFRRNSQRSGRGVNGQIHPPALFQVPLRMTTALSEMVAAKLYSFHFRFQSGDFLVGVLFELSLELRIVLITRQQFKALFLSSERRG